MRIRFATACACEAKKDCTSGETFVPSKHRFAGNTRISGSSEKNFCALVIPGSSQPPSKRGLVVMAPDVINFWPSANFSVTSFLGR
jgi:hypothetical protein